MFNWLHSCQPSAKIGTTGFLSVRPSACLSAFLVSHDAAVSVNIRSSWVCRTTNSCLDVCAVIAQKAPLNGSLNCFDIYFYVCLLSSPAKKKENNDRNIKYSKKINTTKEKPRRLHKGSLHTSSACIGGQQLISSFLEE